MNKKLSFVLLALVAGVTSFAQNLRYYDPVFAGSVVTTQNITYGTNVDFLISGDLADPNNGAQVQQDLIALNTAILTGQPIPANYYTPFAADPSSVVKVTDLQMDIYEPDQSVDTEGARPVMIIIHTGNFLPQIINGSAVGTRRDSSIVNLAKRAAAAGYVAVNIGYRGGWNPLAATVEERRAQLLNAVYRAIHDTKACVRFLKEDAATVNTYAINPNKIVLFGEGSGGYVSLAYASMDKYSELTLPKFTWASGPLVGQSYIDTNTVGNLEGLGGALNLYQDNGFNTNVAMVANTGGALADTSWLEAGDVPMVTFHAVRDGFAPFENGIVIVPTTNEDVVEVQGPNLFMKKANQLGNNDAFKNSAFFADPYTERARAIYGNTYSYYLPAPNNNITVQNWLEGCFPVIKPLSASQLTQNGSPWQWWDLNTLTAVVAATNAALGTSYDANTIHQNGIAGNPDMGPVEGNAYLDTIQGYLFPRVMLSLNLPGANVFSVEEANTAANSIDVFPNPAADHLTINTAEAPKAVTGIEMINALGQVVRSNESASVEIRWDLTGLEGGVYFLNFQFEDGSVGTRKLIVQ